MICECGRESYNDERYSSCYLCYRERRANYVTCFECGVRWHDPDYAACYTCSRQWSASERAWRVEANRSRRMDILYRDGKCVDCGSVEDLQVDHLRPCAKGGDAMPWNLEVRCGECNRIKGDTWWEGCPYDVRRRELIAEYFIAWRALLSDREREALFHEVAAIRGRRYDDEYRRIVRVMAIGTDETFDTGPYERAYPELF